MTTTIISALLPLQSAFFGLLYHPTKSPAMKRHQLQQPWLHQSISRVVYSHQVSQQDHAVPPFFSRQAEVSSEEKEILRARSRSASDRFGVMVVAVGKSSSLRTLTSWSSTRMSPLVATSTGSTTTVLIPHSRTVDAATRMIPAVGSIPVFTASNRISERTPASCCSVKDVGGTCMA